jgi:hypothetical protein
MGKDDFNLLQRVICILHRNPKRIYSIDDLILELDMVSDAVDLGVEYIVVNRDYECRVLDVLIFLNDNGFVVLNSNDIVFITAKGIIMAGDNFFN